MTIVHFEVFGINIVLPEIPQNVTQTIGMQQRYQGLPEVNFAKPIGRRSLLRFFQQNAIMVEKNHRSVFSKTTQHQCDLPPPETRGNGAVTSPLHLNPDAMT